MLLSLCILKILVEIATRMYNAHLPIQRRIVRKYFKLFCTNQPTYLNKCLMTVDQVLIKYCFFNGIKIMILPQFI